MPEIGYIEIKVTDKADTLTPLDVDISEIKSIISDIETFLYPSKQDKMSRPHISYKIEDGSARHKFFTTVASVIVFNSLTAEIKKRGNIDFLDYRQQEVIANFQNLSVKKNYHISFNSSLSKDTTLEITPQTSFQKTASLIYESEFYLYGEIYQEGGKTPNLHIATKEYGNLTIAAKKEQIMEGEKKTYRLYGVKVKGKRNLSDNSVFDLKLIEFIRYNPIFNRDRFNAILLKASQNLNKIPDTDEHINFVKGVWTE